MNLRLQASTPSIHLCSTFLFPAPPQFLNQAPPGAQQLTLPDFSNVPHFGHVIVLAFAAVMVGVLTDAVIGVCTTSSRSGNGRRVMCWRVAGVVAGVETDVHTVTGIDPDEPINIPILLAFECTQAAPQSLRLNDAAFQNM